VGAVVTKERGDTITIGDAAQFTSMEFPISTDPSIMKFIEADDQAEDATIFIPASTTDNWWRIDLGDGQGSLYYGSFSP